jgi:hypothetical protein
MNRRVAFAVSAAAFLVVASGAAVAGGRAAPADGARGQPDVKVMMERSKKCMRDASAFVAKTRFDKKDLERYIAEYPSFDALDIDGDKDRDANGPRCPELSEAVKNPKYVSWARTRGLDPKDWLQKALRISLTDAKRRAPAQAAESKAHMESQKQELAKHCQKMGPDACAQLEKGFAQGAELMREGEAMMALLPDATPTEAALLGEYEARLREATAERHRARRGAEAGPGLQAADTEESGDADAPEEEPPQR